MNKNTHLKFNLNNFLFAISDALDCTYGKNKYHLAYSSKRVAFIALQIAHLNGKEKDFISDLFSYTLICKEKYLVENIVKIPFNNHKHIDLEDFNSLINLALFVEQNIQISNNFIENKYDIINALDANETFDEIFCENLLYLMEAQGFWLDLVNDTSLSFKILHLLEDFTIEYAYEDLINFSELFYNLYYTYTNRIPKESIKYKLQHAASKYNFDEKDTSRFIISGYLSYIGYLKIDKHILFNKDLFLQKDTNLNLEKIQMNAYFTHDILSKIFGFDDIAKLASSFGENIDGSGYPFQKQGHELSLKFRLFAIIYKLQALEEKRSYRKEYSIDEQFEILNQQAKDGLIDFSILNDMR